MGKLLTTEALPFADFIVSRLLKDLPAFPHSNRAVAETAIPIEGDDWYWADDNAKVLELLSLPAVWRAHPEAVTDVVRFVCAMCDGPLIFRRIAAPRFTIEENEGGRGRFLHSLMNISCDLNQGEVTLGMRFHDGRTAKNATFGGNYIRFRHGLVTHTVDAEAGIYQTAIEPLENGVRLSWTSRIEYKKGVFSRQRTHVGDLTYTCTIIPQSMFVTFQADFDISPDIELSDVVLTFGCDRLSHNDNNIRYEMVSAESAGGPVRQTATHGGKIDMPLQGAAYWSIAQTSHMSGFAVAIHSLPVEPARVTGLRGQCNIVSRLHWVASEHEFAGPQRGRITAAERKILTAGGLYADTSLYAETMARQCRLSDAGAPPTDFSVSYDYGAEINAMARCLRTLDDPDPPISGDEAVALREQLTNKLGTLIAAYDRYFVKPARDDTSAVFSRSLAFVAFAHIELLKLDKQGSSVEALREICALIARFERPNTGVDGKPQSGFVMGSEVDAKPYVDCHAPCMLALVRASTILETDEWLEAIDRGLAAFCLDTQKFFFLGDQKIDVVCVDFQDGWGRRHRLETFWNFKSGLCLQLFGALRASPHPGIQRAWEKNRLRIELLEIFMRARIDKSLRRHDDGVEILTSVLSAETNSETQPWVALGLVGEP
jgi:hypothetical protein